MSEDKKDVKLAIADQLFASFKESNSGELNGSVYYDVMANHYGLPEDQVKAVNTANRGFATGMAIAAIRFAADQSTNYQDPMNQMTPQVFTCGDFKATASPRMVGGSLPKDGVVAEKSPAIVCTVTTPLAIKGFVRSNTDVAQAAFKAACGVTS